MPGLDEVASRGWPLDILVQRTFGARYPSGKGEVCKTFMRRFDSGPRLHSSLQSPEWNKRIGPQKRPNVCLYNRV